MRRKKIKIAMYILALLAGITLFLRLDIFKDISNDIFCSSNFYWANSNDPREEGSHTPKRVHVVYDQDQFKVVIGLIRTELSYTGFESKAHVWFTNDTDRIFSIQNVTTHYFVSRKEIKNSGSEIVEIIDCVRPCSFRRINPRSVLSGETPNIVVQPKSVMAIYYDYDYDYSINDKPQNAYLHYSFDIEVDNITIDSVEENIPLEKYERRYNCPF